MAAIPKTMGLKNLRCLSGLIDHSVSCGDAYRSQNKYGHQIRKFLIQFSRPLENDRHKKIEKANLFYLDQSWGWKQPLMFKKLLQNWIVSNPKIMYVTRFFSILFGSLLLVTQSKSKTQITSSVHCKFNCINVKYNGTQHG